MQIVIDIPDEKYKRLPYIDIFSLRKYIENGKPLPKGHGKIGDLTKLYNEIDMRNKGKNKGKFTAMLTLVNIAPTIIEADKENEGKNK